jgi:hypothetical protein
MQNPKNSLARSSILFLIFFQLAPSLGWAKTKKTISRKKPVPVAVESVPTPKPIKPAETPLPTPTPTATGNAPISHDMPQEPLTNERRNYKGKLHTILGSTLVAGHGGSFTLGAQFGVPLKDNGSLYIGPEFTLSYFRPGYLFLTVGSIWYEFRPFGKSHLNLNVGASAGTGFTSLADLAGTNLVAFGDLSLNQEISDLASLRLQLRPGYVGGYFAFLIAANVGFRFQ